MKSLIDFALYKNRATFFLFISLFIVGIHSYIYLPKESSPDIQIPFVFVSAELRGISAEDSERLLVRPMEEELKSLEAVKEMTSVAMDGSGQVTLEFDTNYDINKALSHVRDKIDNIESKLPSGISTPKVKEINLSSMPILYIGLASETLPELTLNKTASSLKEIIESIPGILEVNIAGKRKEHVEIVLNPQEIEFYEINIEKVAKALSRNNTIIPLGSIHLNQSKIPVILPSTFDKLSDIMDTPISAKNHSIIRLKDIAQIKYTFDDPKSLTRMNGKPCVVLEISKRSGYNIIEVSQKVRELLENQKHLIPDNLEIIYSRDAANKITNMISDLENNILFSILLVVAIITIFVNIRSSLLVSIAIPGSFLIGLCIINYLGFTLNIVVLFSLILSVGMLVDSAIVISEYADRKMILGISPKSAFRDASYSMIWPITSSTLTTIVVFMPLLFWPGIVGKFMQYLPSTLIATLFGSIIMALIFIPLIGTIIGKPSTLDPNKIEKMQAINDGNTNKLSKYLSIYYLLLEKVLQSPIKFSSSIVLLMILVTIAFAHLGKGVEFFPKIEPDFINVLIRSSDSNISLEKKDLISKEVEKIIHNKFNKYISVSYSSSGIVTSSLQAPRDTISALQLELTNWQYRPKSSHISSEIKKSLSDVSGVIIDITEEKKGPSGSKPIQISILSNDIESLDKMHKLLISKINTIGGFKNLDNGLELPKLAWHLEINKEKAMYQGTDVLEIGTIIQALTSNGVLLTKYRPHDSTEEIDIIAKFDSDYQNPQYLDSMSMKKNNNLIHFSDFTTKALKQHTYKINRLNGIRSITLSSDVENGILVDEQINKLSNSIQSSEWDPKVLIKFRGETKNQQETSSFLKTAFIIALSAIILILTLEFNSFYFTFVTMTAIFLSTTGVIIGLLITGQPFGIVMCGVGIIALAGIVVNNNILLIDAYKEAINNGNDPFTAVSKAAISRFRPILLTAGTTVLGLIPMIFKINIDFFNLKVTYGAPSGQWWQQLSTAIAGGLAFSTILTLFFTPALLIIGTKIQSRFTKYIAKKP